MSELTINVDVANDGNLVAKLFTKARTLANGLKTLFHSNNEHTTVSPSTLVIGTVDAKTSGNFLGVTRPSVKRTQTITVPGVDPTTSFNQPLIGDISFSVPVGATESSLLLLRQELIAVLDDDSIMIPLMTQNIAPMA